MPSEITLYKVFLASPSDLVKERLNIIEIILSYNQDIALAKGVFFQPVYWEILAAGANNAQQTINSALDTCDYMFAIFNEIWGSPPANNDIDTCYSSGTEEEIYRALSNINDNSLAMADVLIIFRDLNKNKLKDLGPQLKNLLAFKEKIRKDNNNFYKTYKSKGGYKKPITTQLTKWLENHETIKAEASTGNAKNVYSIFQHKHIEHIEFPGEKSRQGKDEIIEALNEASALAEKYDIPGAEQAYINLHMRYGDYNVTNDYAKFLYRLGRLDTAKELFQQIEKLATTNNDMGWVSRSNANLALIFTAQGYPERALQLLTTSLKINRNLKHILGIADNKRHIANIKRHHGKPAEAENLLLEALDAFKSNNYDPGMADTYTDLGILYKSLSQYDQAIENFLFAKTINQAKKRNSCEADDQSQLSAIYRLKGQLLWALEAAESSKEINQHLNRSHGEADALSRIGLVKYYMGDYDEAKQCFLSAIEICTRINNQEGRAKNRAHLARCEIIDKQYEDAKTSLKEALTINTKSDYQEGIAYCGLIQATLEICQTGDHLKNARSEANHSLEIYREIKNDKGKADCYEILAHINRLAGEYPEAISQCEQAISISQKIGAEVLESSARITLASIYACLNDSDKRKEQLKIAENICKNTGQLKALEQVRKMLDNLDNPIQEHLIKTELESEKC